MWVGYQCFFNFYINFFCYLLFLKYYYFTGRMNIIMERYNKESNGVFQTPKPSLLVIFECIHEEVHKKLFWHKEVKRCTFACRQDRKEIRFLTFQSDWKNDHQGRGSKKEEFWKKDKGIIWWDITMLDVDLISFVWSHVDIFSFMEICSLVSVFRWTVCEIYGTDVLYWEKQFCL